MYINTFFLISLLFFFHGANFFVWNYDRKNRYEWNIWSRENELRVILSRLNKIKFEMIYMKLGRLNKIKLGMLYMIPCIVYKIKLVIILNRISLSIIILWQLENRVHKCTISTIYTFDICNAVRNIHFNIMDLQW